MRRLVPALLLLIGACAAQPPERSPLPDVGQVTPEPLGCQLSVGEPLGVSVVSVLEDSVAVGVFLEGDVITSVGGVATNTRHELAEAMAEYSPGNSVEIGYSRDDTPSAATITLGANPDDETKAMIGVTIETAFDKIEPAEADHIILPSDTARPILIAGSIYLFDPLANLWQKTGIVPPADTRWVSTSTGLYSVSDSEPIAILDLIADEEIEGDGFRGWAPQRLIGAVNDHIILVLTAPIPDQPGFVNIAIAGFNPVSRSTSWVSPISNTFGIPVAAYGSPDDTAFVAVGADPETGEQMSVALYDAGGTVQNTSNLGDLGEPMGWFDGRSMAFRSSGDVVSVFDFIAGTTATFTLPANIAGSVTAAVGDGQHVIAVSGRNMQLQDLDEPTMAHPLASNCLIGRTGDPGWGV